MSIRKDIMGMMEESRELLIQQKVQPFFTADGW